MSATYLLRFDDICPRMAWSVWSQVEEILEANNVKPILAVVPDNRDPILEVEPPVSDFWDRVRDWQRRGWTVGLHGYQHRYATRHGGIIGINSYSEFAGVPREQQEASLRSALAIFEGEGVRPDVWIAPAHSFDSVTLDVLAEIGLRRISDGFFFYPHTDARGFTWIPQQLWRLKPRPFGVWTVCHHINSWTADDVGRFRHAVKRYAAAISDWDSVESVYIGRRDSRLDAVVQTVYRQYVFALRHAGEWRERRRLHRRP